MGQIASEALIERLAAWGVDTVFGLPGDGINGIMEGLRRHQDKVRFVLVHHEEAAAFMATGYAKATGRIGVCLATSGPGGIHLLNGLYDAKLDHMPVLAITGMQETSVLGTGYQQEVGLDKLYADVTEYNQMIYNPAQLPGVVDMAIRTAYARRGVAHLTFPNDVQVADADADPWQHVAPARPPQTAPVMLPAPGRPRDEDLQRIAALLNDGREDRDPGRRGRAARPRANCSPWPRPSPRRSSRRCPARRSFPDDSPYTTGGIGLLGTRPVRGADGGDRHPVPGRDQLPVHQAPAPGGQGPGGPDRGRPGPGRRPGGHRGARGRATPRRAWPACCRCSSSAPTPSSWRSARSRWRSGGRRWRTWRTPKRDPIAPQYVVSRAGRAGHQRRHPHLRQRHDRHLGRAALDDPRRPGVLPVRQPGHDGARACPTRSGCSTPSPGARSSPTSATAASPC